MDHQTVNRCLNFTSKMQDNQDTLSTIFISELLKSFSMKDKGMEKIENLNDFEKRCIGICQAMISNQGILALEDPFKGLEREESSIIATALRKEAMTGKTILASVDQH